MADFFDDGRVHDGLTYDRFLSRWKDRADRPPTPGMDKEERKLLHYLNYNWERQAQVHAAYEPSEALREALDNVAGSMVWMVLTEPWCGDSAFLLPVIAEAAQASDAVTLRILLRDDNLDVMDRYLTGESRSIPKLVAFTEDGDELFTWGPRPEAAQERFEELRAQDLPKPKLIQQFLTHYEDGGWGDVEDELVEALRHVKTTV